MFSTLVNLKTLKSTDLHITDMVERWPWWKISLKYFWCKCYSILRNEWNVKFWSRRPKICCLKLVKTHTVFFVHYFLVILMSDWAYIFLSVLFLVGDGSHDVRILLFHNYRCWQFSMILYVFHVLIKHL